MPHLSASTKIRCTSFRPAWDSKGAVDFIRSEKEDLIPVEVKRGRARRTEAGLAGWPSDVLQVGAYAMLLEDLRKTSVRHARIHYARDSAWVHVAVTDDLRNDVRKAIAEARRLSASSRRPPVAENRNLCTHCSLSGVCLPDEERPTDHRSLPAPPDDDRQIVHVTEPGSRVGRAALCLRVQALDGIVTDLPIAQVSSMVLHGNVQLTSQALRLCVERGVGVHWLTGEGTLPRVSHHFRGESHTSDSPIRGTAQPRNSPEAGPHPRVGAHLESVPLSDASVTG